MKFFDFPGSDWVAIAAALAAVVAAIFTGSAALFTRRQSNAVMGNVLPDFSIYQNQFEEYSRRASLTFRITNHNRRAIFIYGLEFDFPKSAQIYQKHNHGYSTLGSIIDAFASGGRNKIFAVPLRIEGCGLNSLPPSETIHFDCQWKNDHQVEGFRLSFSVIYRIDGKEPRRIARGFVDVAAPKLSESDMASV